MLAGRGELLYRQLQEAKVPCRVVKNLVRPVSPADDAAALRQITVLLKELQPDLVATHSNKAGFLGRLAAAKLGLPAVHTSHGFLFGGRKQTLSGRFYRFLERYAAAKGSLVIAVSQSEYDLALRLRVLEPEKMVVIHNGLPDLHGDLIARPQAEPAQLIMVARLAQPKDPQTLIRALAGIKELPWRLKVAGEGPLQQDSQNLAAELKLQERVEFCGMCSDVAQLLAESALFVLSSEREGFPISILEAMRAGLPVVASRVGGVAEAVVGDQTGLLFEAGDSASLQRCLKKLIADPQLREKMGRAGRQRYLERFTLDQMVEKTVAAYHRAVDQGRLLRTGNGN